MSFHIAIFGASKGIANHVLHDLLPTARITLLLRNPNVFDADAAVMDAVKDGRVKLVQGDATVEADVERAIESAEVVLTSIGGTPSFTLRGFKLDNPTVCTDAARALLRVLSRIPLSARPRVIAISSMGIGTNHSTMPLPLRILYPWLLSGPHADKEGLEYLLLRAASAFDAPSLPAILAISGSADTSADPALENILPHLILVRPALLTDGAPAAVRAAEDLSAYSVSRASVGRWIAQHCMPDQDQWVNRAPVLGY
ncbi:hypothetical protein CC85DRAFT_285959 [Cutaneotrichosporon oleaginosum]|uniref:NAD(P)-binding domain-containing protein n=1 Tax=Cutaneotrichosporon oleaginosum TaxID=879819 RepID=A0A0J0XLP3_9TREE|nr:uncharacterized protein CC85DRAFT_285959 [Cutaneotrichosporon oleaginosum]KLT42031.1 hypothetical protein CC85DRAFT_285959 [Cutaneotrichosporon oleaginosum]TXT14313.1 hypothetical protein COLE_00506 [Cutaneotrichosporon oleaginosum]